MRVQNIKIVNLRNFDNIEINFSPESPMICIVGANGVGKSQLLELIAACSRYIGLTPGSESNRSSPISEEGRFAVKFYIPIGLIPEVEDEKRYPDLYLESFKNWDRTITVHHETINQFRLECGSSLNAIHPEFANYTTQITLASTSVHYLSLDADRSYPKITIQAHEFSQVYDRDWDQTNKQSSFRLAKNLYEEWIRYLVGQENQINNSYAQSIRLERVMNLSSVVRPVSA